MAGFWRAYSKGWPITNTATEALSVVIEREIPYPPEKIWRALTQPHLIEEWLMKNDLKPVVGHRFNLRADWDAVDCQVLAVEHDLPGLVGAPMPDQKTNGQVRQLTERVNR
jgi:hypothetical protein